MLRDEWHNALNEAVTASLVAVAVGDRSALAPA